MRTGENKENGENMQRVLMTPNENPGSSHQALTITLLLGARATCC